MTTNWRERIERDPGTQHGEPHIRGTRIPVSAVVNNVAIRADLREVLASYPSLSEEDVRACVAYAAERSHGKDGVIDADFDGSPEPGEAHGVAEPAQTLMD